MNNCILLLITAMALTGPDLDWLTKKNTHELLDESKPYFDYPLDLDCDSSGWLFVLDRNKNLIFKVAHTGEVLFSFGGKGTSPGELSDPVDIAVDRIRDRVWVADFGGRRIACFDTNGMLLLHKEMSFQVCNIAVRTDGKVIAGGSSTQNLNIFDEKLKLLKSFGAPNDGTAKGYDYKYMHLRVDDDDKLFVAYALSPVISSYDSDCDLLWEVERPWVSNTVTQRRTTFSEGGKRLNGSAHHDSLFFFKGKLYLSTRDEGALIAINPLNGSYLGHQKTNYLIRGFTRFENLFYTCTTKNGGAFRVHTSGEQNVMTEIKESPNFEHKIALSKNALVDLVLELGGDEATAGACGKSTDGNCSCSSGEKAGKEVPCQSSCCNK